MAAATLGEEGIAGILGLTLALGEESQVGSSFSLVLGRARLLEGNHVTLALEALGGHKALDLGGLGVGLATLGGDGAADDALADIIGGIHTPKLTDVAGTLGSETDVLGGVSEAGNVGTTTLDNDKVQHGEILVDDAPTDGLALALTSATLAVALGALLEEQTDTGVGEDTLKHRESLLVVPAGDAEAVSLELGSEDVAAHFLGDALVVASGEDLLVVDHQKLPDQVVLQPHLLHELERD